MKQFVILIYEDDATYVESLMYSLDGKIKLKGKKLVVHHKENGDSLDQDLNVYSPNLIMVDHDLGATTGDDLIQIIDSMPEHNSVSIYYYSGGETLDDLEEKARRHKCNIRCFTKEGDNLDIAILGLVE
ncbi:hypothetical protein [Algoriphagus sp.]|uniref:hypothetical protein n=1 Tax=Algoriphagus sp. TaxID=1872435 RepID=UPI002723AF54|nr:hypothetical protein [Algoriphagus sp.]MDO8965735.1 hypothetical protein [Algoriphagus sp.]MDP3198830.1 hypothetical protein [Algoriphagus sp.]